MTVETVHIHTHTETEKYTERETVVTINTHKYSIDTDMKDTEIFADNELLKQK